MEDRENISVLKMQFKYTLIVAGKNAKIYYLKAPVLIFGLLFPLTLFLAFSIGRNIPVETLFPGLIGITIFFTTSSSNPIITPWETRMKTLERLVSTPASISSIILGDMLAGFIFGMFITLVPLALGLFVFGIIISSPFLLLVNIILSSVCFATLGTLLSSPPTDNPSNIMMLSNLIRLPLIFISGVFIPIEQMPEWAEYLSVISPLTYSADFARHAITGEGHFSILINIALLITFILIFGWFSIKLHKKNIPLRIQ